MKELENQLKLIISNLETTYPEFHFRLSTSSFDGENISGYSIYLDSKNINYNRYIVEILSDNNKGNFPMKINFNTLNTKEMIFSYDLDNLIRVLNMLITSKKLKNVIDKIKEMEEIELKSRI